jgi:hypothetical protein
MMTHPHIAGMLARAHLRELEGAAARNRLARQARRARRAGHAVIHGFAALTMVALVDAPWEPSTGTHSLGTPPEGRDVGFRQLLPQPEC